MAQSRSKRQTTRNSSSASAGRNYASEYANYQGTPEQIANRGMRNAARREYEQANGSLPSNVDVDHRNPIVKGGDNSMSNLRDRPRSDNRSFKRDKKAGMI